MANSRGRGCGHGRSCGRGRGTSTSTCGSSVPLVKQEPLSDTPEIIIKDEENDDHHVLQQEEKKKLGRQTAKRGRPYGAQAPVRKIESPVEPCSVQLNQAECGEITVPMKVSTEVEEPKPSERKEEILVVKQNDKKNTVPTKVSTEVEEPKPSERKEEIVVMKTKQIEQSEK